MAITVAQILALNPCNPPYSEQRLTELFDGRSSMSASDILQTDTPGIDRLWLIFMGNLLTQEQYDSINQAFLDRYEINASCLAQVFYVYINYEVMGRNQEEEVVWMIQQVAGIL